jgi:hypothetical protein
MKNKAEQPAEGLGLLANGSAGHWDVAVDEAASGDEWFLELDGPQVYLVFQLENLKVVETVLQFLQAGSLRASGRGDSEAALPLGRFESAAVSLLWDNEDFPRCFIVVGPAARSTLRLSLEAEDIQMLVEALRQVVKDIPQGSGE